MATRLTYSDTFSEEFDGYVHSAYLDFGSKAAKNWVSSYQAIVKRLKVMPESYPYVMIGKCVFRQYRGANFMHNFKLVYKYDSDKDEARVVKILDMRRNPNSLIREVKGL